MTWYGKNAGTVSVTNGSTAVIGTGTAFIANCKVGDEFKLEGGMRGYEIIARPSDTELTIDPPYLDASESGKAYRIVPTRGGPVSAAFETVQSILSQWNTYLSGVLSGLFPAGTAGSPSIARQGDTNTGFYWPAADQIAAATNGIRRWLLSATAMQVDVPITGTAVVQDATDTTAGRIMTNGAGGWHGTVATTANDANNANYGGMFMTSDLSTATNWPAWFTSGPGALLVVAGQNSNNFHQIALAQNGGMPPGFRNFRAGVFGSWSRAVMLDTLLGTVSQSGGVPTGALFQVISNPNGIALRMTDGTQICCFPGIIDTSVAATSLHELTWTFPAAFVSAPCATINLRSNNTATGRSVATRLFDGSVTPNSGSSAVVTTYNGDATSQTLRADVVATGRWL